VNLTDRVRRQGPVLHRCQFHPSIPCSGPGLPGSALGPGHAHPGAGPQPWLPDPALLDRSGNPVGRLPHIPLITEDLSPSTRDGHLRQAITQLLDLAEVSGASSITIEDLGFSAMRSTGRGRYGSRRWFRQVISGVPTAKFRDRLVAMASRRGIAVVGVPAAYSSIWGRQHWLAPLLAQQVSGHTAAAVVLGIEDRSGGATR